MQPDVAVLRPGRERQALVAELIPGLAGIAGGVLTLVFSRRYTLAPVSAGEARQLADRYNASLKERLGLDGLGLHF